MLIETLVAARDVGRLNTIAGVLIRHGLGDVVHRLGLADQRAYYAAMEAKLKAAQAALAASPAPAGGK